MNSLPQVDLIDALPLAIMMIDAQKRVAICNVPMTEILGNDLVGLHYIAALRQPDLLDAIERVTENETMQSVRYHGRDGDKDTNYLVCVTPVDGQIILTFEDLTAVQEVNRLRREFVANVSHELRTPLTALLGFIETLRGAARDDPAAQERFLKIMAQEASRMTRLVDDLLSLSRVEEDARVRPNAMVSLNEIVESTLERLAPLISKSDIKIQFDVADTGLKLPGDKEQLQQVVANLVENAVKYGATAGHVVVSISDAAYEARLQGHGVRLAITDHGEGIAAHHIARLTERFYRVDNHRSREVGGTGLGLAIVKHIVNRHRGRIVVESTLGQGTTCTVILPTA